MRPSSQTQSNALAISIKIAAVLVFCCSPEETKFRVIFRMIDSAILLQVGSRLMGLYDSGRKFDKVGNLTQWWPDDIIEKFKERAVCFVDQYAQLPIDMVGQNVNGNQTLDDNICDNSGLKQAYWAYKHYVAQHGEEPTLPGIGFSNLQVFFMQYAQIWCEVLSKEANEKYIKDNHSPGKYRANIPLINSAEFSSTFNCPLGSPMNPVKKCRLWG
ncbi:neprilysin-2-like [Stegodyphus dumicola]|uniref:neprilysin-2-like n=1 Tax=Stegodyphus dumicola TaxID=202533 RepID=UPI0015B023DC|nr:neprilysin-2-like [Stegodyphus dumicola]